MPRAVDGVVFDLDGTLIDSYEAIAASLNHARAAFALGPLTTAEVRLRVGHGLESLVAELVGPGRVESGVRLFRERYAETFAAGTSALPGVATTLAALSRLGLRMSVASNKPARFSAAILAALGLAGHLDPIAGPDVVGATKPDPRMVAFCLERMGVPAERAVYVGDMLLDVETARRAGIRVVLVEGGSSPAAQLRGAGVPVLGSITELPELIGTLAPA